MTISAQNIDTKACHRFKKGYFIFEAKEKEVYLIKRSRVQQEEIELYSQSKVTTNVKWLSDCVYELALQKEKNDSTKNISIPIIIRILETRGNSYVFTSASFDDLIVLEGKMKKIRRREYRRRLKELLD